MPFTAKFTSSANDSSLDSENIVDKLTSKNDETSTCTIIKVAKVQTNDIAYDRILAKPIESDCLTIKKYGHHYKLSYTVFFGTINKVRTSLVILGTVCFSYISLFNESARVVHSQSL